MTPADLLASAPVHTIGDTAIILGHRTGDGQPNRRVVRDMIRTGALRLVDPTQPVTRWTVSTAEIYRYINDGPRTADVQPLVVAPNPDTPQPPVTIPKRRAS